MKQCEAIYEYLCKVTYAANICRLAKYVNSSKYIKSGSDEEITFSNHSTTTRTTCLGMSAPETDED